MRPSGASHAARPPRSLFARTKTYSDGRNPLGRMGSLERDWMAHCPSFSGRGLWRMGLVGAWWTWLRPIRPRLSLRAHDVAPGTDHSTCSWTGAAGRSHWHSIAAPRSMGKDAGYRDRLPDTHQAPHRNHSRDLYPLGVAACAVGPGV